MHNSSSIIFHGYTLQLPVPHNHLTVSRVQSLRYIFDEANVPVHVAAIMVSHRTPLVRHVLIYRYDPAMDNEWEKG
jgi:hypothetical protein